MRNYSRKYDVIIVGCGPGGAYLGYLLASGGMRVLILEKKRFPRYKTCGGGLTRRVLDLLPFSVDAVVEDYIYRARVGLGDRVVVEKSTDCPMIAMVMRDRFDSFLAERAVEAGARIMGETSFRTVFGNPGNLAVETSRGVFRSRILAGADGVHSRVARSLGIPPAGNAGPALEAEVYFRREGSIERFRNTVHFDFGTMPRGYAWIFPKQDHLSVGVMSAQGKKPGIKKCLESYLKFKEISDGIEIRSLRGHLIPLGAGKRKVFAVPEGLLVGDAAALADPITGEGIFHALRQAEIAAGVVEGCLGGEKTSLLKYNSLIKKEFVSELRYAGMLAGFFYGLEGITHRILKIHGDRITDYHLDIITGARTYRELFFRAFNPLGLIPWI